MIISDATAIITLINIQEFDILKQFTSKIILTKKVYEEVCCFDAAKIFLEKYIKEDFIVIEECKNKILFEEINILLDDGESSSIALAIEKKVPLIIDEKKGRKFAQGLGIEIIGLVGIIRFLYLENNLNKTEVMKLIKKLNSSDFRISDKLIAMILRK